MRVSALAVIALRLRMAALSATAIDFLLRNEDLITYGVYNFSGTAA